MMNCCVSSFMTWHNEFDSEQGRGVIAAAFSLQPTTRQIGLPKTVQTVRPLESCTVCTVYPCPLAELGGSNGADRTQLL